MTDDTPAIPDLLTADLRQQLLVRLRDTSADARRAVDSAQEEVFRHLREMRDEFTWLRMYYSFGIQEVLTKVEILRQEFETIYDYSPIEHVRSRLKSED